MPLIQIRNLNVYYQKQQALREVSVDIPDRAITAVIGPSGCGKTTLLKSINRLTDLGEGIQVKGEILIDGANVLAPSADLLLLRKKIGFLSQRPFPLPMSIRDNLTFAPRVHGMRPRDIVEQIRQMETHWPMVGPGMVNRPLPGRRSYREAGLLLTEYYLRLAALWDEVKDRLDSPAQGLSVGQQQRLSLARALAVNPEAVLADEPTSALDPTSSSIIEKQLKLLRGRFTFVVVTHILRQAKRLADYVLFLYLGELVEHGPAAEVFTHPRDPRTRAYLSGEIS